MRFLRRFRPSTLLASALLALGLGSALGLFALVHALLYRPLPGMEGMWSLSTHYKGEYFSADNRTVPYAVLKDLRPGDSPFQALGLHASLNLSVRGTEGRATRRSGGLVGAPFLGALGLRPAYGRDFEVSEAEAAPDVVILSHHFWRAAFHGDPSVVGRLLRINGRDCQVVGVGPEGFRGFSAGFPTDAFLPLGAYSRFMEGGRSLAEADLEAFGRLAPGWTAAQAQDLLTARYRAVPDPSEDPNRSVRLTPFADLRREGLGAFLHQPALLGCATGLLLLLACVSASILQLSEVLRERRTLLLRMALGASPFRLAGEALLKAALPAFLGGIGALGVARLLLGAFLRFQGVSWGQRSLEVSFGGPVLAAALTLALLGTLLVSLAPALFLLRLDPMEALREGPALSPHHRLREGLVVLQVALSLALMAGALALASDLSRRLKVPSGFHSEGLAMLTVDPGVVERDPERQRSFEKALAEEARSLPGVQSVALISSPPQDVFKFALSLDLEPGGKPEAFSSLLVDDAFPAILGVPLVEGRSFTSEEGSSNRKLMLVNETFARKYFPGRSPVGQHVGENQWEILGVVKNHRYFPDEPNEVRPHLYIPRGKFRMPGTVVLARSDHPEALLPLLRDALHRVQPDLPARELGTVRAWMDRAEAPRRLAAGLLGLFGLLSLVLSLSGLGGTLWVQALARRREWGIRLALGATPRQIAAKVLARGLVLGGLGTLLGALATWALGRLLLHTFGSDFGAVTGPFLLAALAMAATVLLASLLPALAAARVEPAKTLHSE